eukprot:2127051-Karenia_brevis.AAC.1
MGLISGTMKRVVGVTRQMLLGSGSWGVRHGMMQVCRLVQGYRGRAVMGLVNKVNWWRKKRRWSGMGCGRRRGRGTGGSLAWCAALEGT